MSDVERLLHEFIAEDRATGPADPSGYLARVEGTARAELAALVDAYLTRAPRRPFDRSAFEASPARLTAEALARSLAGTAGTWPALLPRLRDRARLRRAEVVQRLASELGAGEREDKVARYYHQMEQGTLPAAGVSDRVLEALGRIVGESAGALRAAGRAMAGRPGDPEAAVTFARVGTPDEALLAEAVAAAPAEPLAKPGARDEIDDLFTGASDDTP
jgi:hypothetical protein